MTASVFVDTNVLVYARDAGEPRKQARAMDWLARLWRARTGRLSVQVLSEYYVTVTRKLVPGLRPDDAWDDVKADCVAAMSDRRHAAAPGPRDRRHPPRGRPKRHG